MEKKVWRTDVEGNRGEKMLENMIYLPIIVTGVALAFCTILVMIIMELDIQNDEVVSWLIIIPLLIMTILVAILPRKLSTKTNNAKNIYARDGEGNLWYFTYNHPAFWGYFKKNYSRIGEGFDFEDILSILFYRRRMRDFVSLITLCEQKKIIEKLMEGPQRDLSLYGFKVLRVSKLRNSPKRTTVKFDGEENGIRIRTFTIDISGYEDVQSLTMEFEKRMKEKPCR